MTIAQDLLEGKASIGVIGLGFIGTTTAMAFATAGVKVVGVDVNPVKVERYRNGICDVVNLQEWSGTKLKPLIDSGMIRPTTEMSYLKDCPVIFIAVPTEKDGRPYRGYIDKVLSDIQHKVPWVDHPIIVFESTLSPKWGDVFNSTMIAVAPRRDWFADSNWSLQKMPRIWWAHEDVRDELQGALSIVCQKLILAPNAKSASLTKAVENAMLHAEIALVQQLADEYVDQGIDVNWVAKAVGTHPRLPTRYPGIRVGGYCVELGSHYVSDGARGMSISTEAIRTNQRIPLSVSKAIQRFAKIGILGITYKNDLKVHTLSAAIDLARQANGRARAQDPYYGDDEIRQVLGCEPFRYPEDLGEFDCLVIVTDHKEYARTPLWVLKERLQQGVAIVDNLGVWERWRKHFSGYRRFGTDALKWP